MNPHDQAIIHGSGRSDWRTPREMADRLIGMFGCAIDLAADSGSCLIRDTAGFKVFLGPGSAISDNGLGIGWIEAAHLASVPPVGFLNPPYSLQERKTLKAQGLPYAHLEIERWAEKAYTESLQGFTTIGVFPYSPQTEWFRRYVMGHIERPVQIPEEPGACTYQIGWSGHAALDYWRLPHRVSFLQSDGSPSANAGVNSCVIIWGPNPGFVGPWVPSGRYWSYR